MPSNLTIRPNKPFKSSRLAVPPSPFSPLFPVSPPPLTQNPPSRTSNRHPSTSDLPPPPSEPLNWLWQCHLCNRVYKLGTTRRCLEDGHFFCSGTTTVKRSRRGKNAGKKVLRHKACASEFDYAGWKTWGVWRRDVRGKMVVVDEGEGNTEDEDVPKPLFAAGGPDEGSWLRGLWAGKGKRREGKKDGDGSGKKDCWGTCDYPSECRWGKQYGVDTPTLPPPPVPEKDTEKPKTKFEDILITIPEISSGSGSESEGEEDVTIQSPPLSPELPESLEEPTRKPSFDDLLESVKRRKRRSAGAVVDVPSPLASHPPSPTTISMAQAMDLAGSSGEHVEDVARTPTTAFQSGEIAANDAAGQTALQRAFDDSIWISGSLLSGRKRR